MRRVVASAVFCLFLAVFSSANAIHTPAESDRIVRSPTFYYREKNFELRLSSEQMEYLLDNLPLASSMINEWGIHTIEVESSGKNRYTVRDANGLQGHFRLVGKAGGSRRYLGKGSIYSRLTGSIRADVAARIRYREKNGCIVNDLEFWVLLDNSFINVLCRVFRPVVRSVVRRKMDFFIVVAQDFAERYNDEGLEVENIDHVEYTLLAGHPSGGFQRTVSEGASVD